MPGSIRGMSQPAPAPPVPAPRRFADLAGLVSAEGQCLGHSGWHHVDQDRVDRFAAATGDDQWIHVDPVRASAGPFGGPIVPGYLLLSLVPLLLGDVFAVDGIGMMINTGVDRLRFLTPVPVGSRVRLAADLASARYRARGAVEVGFEARIEVRDRGGPAATALVGMILRPGRPARARPDRALRR